MNADAEGGDNIKIVSLDVNSIWRLIDNIRPWA